MESMIKNKHLTLDHKFVLLLIVRVESAKTLYNIRQTLGLLGYYIEDCLSIIKDLSQLDLIKFENFKESASIYEGTEIGQNLLNLNENIFKSELLDIVERKELFLKICFTPRSR